jgi:hypothetical protein
MLSTDTQPAASVFVTITNPDGSVEAFNSTPSDGMLVCLSDWDWLGQHNASGDFVWHCDAAKT